MRSTGSGPPRRARAAEEVRRPAPGGRLREGGLGRRSVLPHDQGHSGRRHRDRPRTRHRRRRSGGLSCTDRRACSPPRSPPRCRTNAAMTRDTPALRRPSDERAGHRPARVAQDAAAVGDAGDPGCPPRPGPRRRTRPPRLPPGPLPGRDRPPRDRRLRTPSAQGEVRAAGHAGRLRLQRLPEAARGPDPPSPRPSDTSPSAKAPTSASPRPAAFWPSSPAATRTAPGTGACANSSAPTC